MNILIIYLLTITFITFVLFAIDKYKAKKSNHQKVSRISEKTLLIFSFLGGTLGAIISMILFRHKIKKISFLIKFIVVVLIQIGLFWVIFSYGIL